jgi:cytochrome c biogenesis protein CcmG, thiol:disulfide interchange protein DsbE
MAYLARCAFQADSTRFGRVWADYLKTQESTMLLRRTIMLVLATGALHTSSPAAPPQTVSPQTLTQLQADPQRITVVDFFAQWCASCRKELPLISALHTRVDKTKVEFIGVDTDESVEVGVAFQNELRASGGLNFRVVNDPKQQIVKQLKPRGYPALYIIKDGVVVREYLGALANLDTLLAQDLKALGVH